MPIRFQDITEVGLYALRDDGVLDNQGKRLGMGYAVFDWNRPLDRQGAMQAGDTYYCNATGRYWGGSYATYHTTRGEAFEVAQERYVSYIIDVATGIFIDVPNFRYEDADLDHQDDDYEDDICNDPFCECRHDGSDDDEGSW